MKYSILIVVLFCVGLSFAQSKKKINEQLTSELVSARWKYDSITALASGKASQLLGKQTDFVNAQLRNKQRQATNLKDAFAKVEKEYDRLIRLGEDPAKLIDLDSLKREMIDFQEGVSIVDLSENVLEPQKPFLFEGSLSTEKRSKKEQNIWLREQLAKYSHAIEENKVKIVHMDGYLKKIDLERPRLDSIYWNYEHVLYDLAIGEASLLKMIRELKEFSVRDWPKNFSEVFEREFGTPERNEIGEPTSDGWNSIVYYTYQPGFDGYIQYANPIPINKFSLEKMKEQGAVNPFKPNSMIIYSAVDETAEFPGGNSALRTFLTNNYRVPQIAEELGISCKMRMKFVVSQDGSISDVKVEKGCPDCPECDAEAIRIMNKMPKWKPGKINSKAVKSWYYLPIQIHLD